MIQEQQEQGDKEVQDELQRDWLEKRQAAGKVSSSVALHVLKHSNRKLSGGDTRISWRDMWLFAKKCKGSSKGTARFRTSFRGTGLTTNRQQARCHTTLTISTYIYCKESSLYYLRGKGKEITLYDRNMGNSQRSVTYMSRLATQSRTP
jgi:hypothetical protein